VAESIPYRTMDSVALHYPFEVDAPYFGLVSLDNVYDVAWVSREHCKPGHVPDGESIVIVQLGPAWATTHPKVTPAEAATAASERAADLIDDERLRDPDWWDYQRWGAAIPAHGPGDSLLDRSIEYDLALAGDWVAGIGRTRAAFQSGLDAGREITIRLD
jgi:hypothetical protein